jgi:hypothetical protein
MRPKRLPCQSSQIHQMPRKALELWRTFWTRPVKTMFQLVPRPATTRAIARKHRVSTKLESELGKPGLRMRNSSVHRNDFIHRNQNRPMLTAKQSKWNLSLLVSRIVQSSSSNGAVQTSGLPNGLKGSTSMPSLLGISVGIWMLGIMFDAMSRRLRLRRLGGYKSYS